jgi:hypothetical protein
MLAGAGMLGGGQYLLSKMDEKREKGMLSDFREYASSSPLAQSGLADGLLSGLESNAANSSLLGRTSGQTQSLINDFMKMDTEFQQDQMQLQAEMQDAYSKSNLGQAEQLQTNWEQAQKEFGGVQKQMQSAMLALENPSNLNSITSLYNLFAIIEPGGRVTQNEDGTFTGTGNGGNRLANWANEWRGEGLTPASIKEISESLWAQYTPKLENARRVKSFYENKMSQIQASGRNVQSPIGSLGIDFGLNQFSDSAPQAANPNKDEPTLRPTLPPGLSYTNPNPTKKQSVREQRGRGR